MSVADTSTITQPVAAIRCKRTRAHSSCTSQAMPPSGLHCQISSPSAALDASTKVLRSTAGGTIVVQARLNPGRAITEC